MVSAIMEESKRRKIEDSSSSSSTSSSKKIRKSRIFSPFRSIGNVSNGVPFSVGNLGQSFYIATVVGNSFQIYDASTLHLLFVSERQTPAPITYITSHFHYIYCSYANKIGIFKRGKLEYELSLPDNSQEKIEKLLVFGNYLIATTLNSIYIFEKDLSTSATTSVKYPTSFYTCLKINSLIHGEIVDLIHLPTYINKIIVATTNHLLVYNIKSGKLLFTSDEFITGITCIEPAPALDVLAIGNGEGTATIYNIKKGKTIQTVQTGSNSKITSISFRTDGLPHLVCSLINGDLFFYDLNKKSRVHILRNAHKEKYGGVSKSQFLNNQPIVVTSGPDNSLKEFVFDPILSTTNTSVISPPRHLRSRGGHSASPTNILFADERSHFIQSASQDKSFWTFSLLKDAQSQEMSQKQSKTNKEGKRQAGLSSGFKDKLPPIVTMTQENARQGEWDNIITGHQDEIFARTWDSKNKKLGNLQLPTIDKGTVKSVAITQCGNFGLIGSSLGGIGSYNLQSGKIRKLYKLHKKSCTGIAVDGMNRKMVSCGLDGIIGFYDFSKSTFLGKLVLNSPITQLCYHRKSDLVAFACDDLSIVVVDSTTQKFVRQLFGHTNRITSMDFTPDGRWIISASLDGTIRTWDLPTGGCIDGIHVPNVVTCLKMSPQGDVLATTHVNGLGISLWTNRSQFKPISTRHVEEEEFANVMLPNVSGDGGSSILDGAFGNENGEDDDDDEDDKYKRIYKSVDQINENLITLSLGPRNKFNTLIHLDTIKLRNKPKEAPKQQEKLPFFLELTGSQVGDRAKQAENETDANQIQIQKSEMVSNIDSDSSKLLSLSNDKEHSFESNFTKILRESSTSTSNTKKNYSEFINFLVELSPANIDLEIRSLNTIQPYDELIWFIEALTFGLNSNKNFELIQAFMQMLLRLHGDIFYLNVKKVLSNKENYTKKEVRSSTRLFEKLNEFNQISKEKRLKLDDLTKYCSGLINFINKV